MKKATGHRRGCVRWPVANVKKGDQTKVSPHQLLKSAPSNGIIGHFALHVPHLFEHITKFSCLDESRLRAASGHAAGRLLRWSGKTTSCGKASIKALICLYFIPRLERVCHAQQRLQGGEASGLLRVPYGHLPTNKYGRFDSC